jgi:hypothetical protein
MQNGLDTDRHSDVTPAPVGVQPRDPQSKIVAKKWLNMLEPLSPVKMGARFVPITFWSVCRAIRKQSQNL